MKKMLLSQTSTLFSGSCCLLYLQSLTTQTTIAVSYPLDKYPSCLTNALELGYKHRCYLVEHKHLFYAAKPQMVI